MVSAESWTALSFPLVDGVCLNVCLLFIFSQNTWPICSTALHHHMPKNWTINSETSRKERSAVRAKWYILGGCVRNAWRSTKYTFYDGCHNKKKRDDFTKTIPADSMLCGYFSPKVNFSHIVHVSSYVNFTWLPTVFIMYVIFAANSNHYGLKWLDELNSERSERTTRQTPKRTKKPRWNVRNNSLVIKI